MMDYRINVRFHMDDPAERRAAEYLRALESSRNQFVVDAVIARMNQALGSNEELLESIRQIFREEVQSVSVVTTANTIVPFEKEMTEEQKAENARNVLADLEMFG